jgi:hypothetical protein
LAINDGKAFDVGKNGYVISDDNGDPLHYFTTGSGLPYGNQAPLNTFYVNSDDHEMWKKIGTGVNDWRVFDAFGKPFNIVRLSGTFSTSSDTFVDALTQTITGIPAGKYALHWAFQASNSNSGTANIVEPRMNGFALSLYTTTGKVSGDPQNDGPSYAGVAELNFNAGNLTVSLAIRRSAGSGSGNVTNVSLMAYRLETPF